MIGNRVTADYPYKVGDKVQVSTGYNLGQVRRTLKSVIGTIVRIVGHLYEVELPDGELRLYAAEGIGAV